MAIKQGKKQNKKENSPLPTSPRGGKRSLTPDPSPKERGGEVAAPS